MEYLETRANPGLREHLDLLVSMDAVVFLDGRGKAEIQVSPVSSAFPVLQLSRLTVFLVRLGFRETKDLTDHQVSPVGKETEETQASQVLLE